jgi:putative spermidine/putrescine transport system ATP-binding protein
VPARSTAPPDSRPAARPDAQRADALTIEVRRVVKRYGPVSALDHVDLDVRSGEFLTLLGPSGSGKSTLLMVLAGFIRPDHGSIRFGEADVTRLAPHKRNVGMVFQNYALFPHMDVAGNIGFPLRLRGVARAEIGRRVEHALQMVQLAGYGERRIEQLSGGQRQRVALARAIVFEPRIVLMDEPLSALDKQLRERMQIELRQLHEKLGTTTIYVTHDQREALTMSDRVAVIDRGRVMQLDTPRAIYEQPASRFVAEFIGESNFLPVRHAGGEYRCAGAALRLSGAPSGPGPWLLMLRPERLRILDRATHPDLNVFEARVANVVYQGDSLLVQAALADGSRISARGIASNGAMGSAPRNGDVVMLGLSPQDTVLVPDADH